MFFRRKRRRGLGLTGILIIIAVLYFTGAGKWLWDQVLQAENGCYAMMAQMGTSAGAPLCAGIGTAVRAADDVVSNIDQTAENAWQSVLSVFSADSLSSVVGQIQIPHSLEDLGSSGEELSQRMRAGAGYTPTGDKLRNAIDSFRIGRSLMNGSVNPVSNAVPWLQQGASTPGYGLLSQLSLGDIYRNGQGNVSANPGQAVQYYSSAYQSINMLQSNPSPEAQQLLKTLPDSPEAIKQRLVQAVKELKQKMKEQ